MHSSGGRLKSIENRNRTYAQNVRAKVCTTVNISERNFNRYQRLTIECIFRTVHRIQFRCTVQCTMYIHTFLAVVAALNKLKFPTTRYGRGVGSLNELWAREIFGRFYGLCLMLVLGTSIRCYVPDRLYTVLQYVYTSKCVHNDVRHPVTQLV